MYFNFIYNKILLMEQALRQTRNIKKESPFYKRIVLIDFLRGLFLCFVFIDHIIWDFTYFFPQWSNGPNSLLSIIGSLASDYWVNPYRKIIQFIGLTCFVLLSGISCAFSKSNTKRSVKMIGLFLAIGVITNLANSFIPTGSVINFNVIGVIACSVLIYSLFENKSLKVIVAFWAILFLFYLIGLPILYENFSDGPGLVWPLWNTTDVIVNGKPYYQADYMSLFPFILFFFLGVLIAKTYYKDKNKHLGKHYNFEKPICFIGRHSFIFYIGHQLVFMAIFYFIDFCIKL